jgi:hypothetical protein
VSQQRYEKHPNKKITWKEYVKKQKDTFNLWMPLVDPNIFYKLWTATSKTIIV